MTDELAELKRLAKASGMTIKALRHRGTALLSERCYRLLGSDGRLVALGHADDIRNALTRHAGD